MNEPFPADAGKPGELGIQVIPLKKAALVLRAVNHHLRQQVLKRLHRLGPLTVTELYRQMRLEQSEVSQHLAILRRAGLVNTLHQGRFVYYSVNHQRLQNLHRCCSLLTGER